MTTRTRTTAALASIACLTLPLVWAKVDLSARSRTAADESRVHAPPPKKCTFDKGSEKCQGFPEDWNDTSDLNRWQLARWIAKKDKFQDKNRWVRRVPPEQELNIDMVVDAQDLALEDLAKVANQADAALVVARIQARMASDSPQDTLFRVGPQKQGDYSGDFYLVITGYHAGAPLDTKRMARWVSDWQVYGRKKDYAVLRLLSRVSTRQGRFWRCESEHDEAVRKLGAQFITCPGATLLGEAIDSTRGLAEALRRDPLFSTRAIRRTGTAAVSPSVYERRIDDYNKTWTLNMSPRVRTILLQLLVDSATAPAWVPCGIGCCTADFGA